MTPELFFEFLGLAILVVMFIAALRKGFFDE